MSGGMSSILTRKKNSESLLATATSGAALGYVGKYICKLFICRLLHARPSSDTMDDKWPSEESCSRTSTREIIFNYKCNIYYIPQMQQHTRLFILAVVFTHGFRLEDGLCSWWLCQVVLPSFVIQHFVKIFLLPRNVFERTRKEQLWSNLVVQLLVEFRDDPMEDIDISPLFLLQPPFDCFHKMYP